MAEIFTAAFWAEYGGILAEGVWDTLLMTGLSTLLAYLIGLPMGVTSIPDNITTEGIVLKDLSPGTRLRLGETEVEVTQIGKECHNDCAIKKATGTCVMPTEGIFVAVLKEGAVRAGDPVEIIKEAAE